MGIYLLKSSICLFIFMAFYKVILERTSMHYFKRIYLLSIVLISVGIPFITFTQYIEPNSLLSANANLTIMSDKSDLESNLFYDLLPSLLWSIYAIGVVLFSFKFVRNLFIIVTKIRKNPKQKHKRFINVLLSDVIVPHTFFSYIFFNKTKYENNEIPQEVVLHEELHAKQKHSLDVVFIELLQIVFWFNPLIYLLKRDIKLNHEFLADNAVISNGIPPSNYQQILLAFSSSATEPQMANAINYSSIKKRFTVMKTHTSKQAIWLRSLVLLPLLAFLIYSFSTTKNVEKDSVNKDASSKFSEAGVKNSLNATPQEIATAKQVAEYNTLAKYYNNALTKKDFQIKMSDVKRLKSIYAIMSDAQKKTSEPFPNFPPPPPPAPDAPKAKKAKDLSDLPPPPPPPVPDNATPEQREKYEKMTAMYTEKRAKHAEKERLTAMKERLQERQEKMANREKEIIGKRQHLKSNEAKHKGKLEKSKERKLEREEKMADRIQKREETMNKRQSHMIKKGEVSDIPPPPPPLSPLDHVIDMSKKGAIFYYEDKPISSDKAIDIVKRNSSINISSKGSNSKRPIVRLSIKPITIKN